MDKKIKITGTDIGIICSVLGCAASAVVIVLEENKSIGAVLLLCCIACLFSMFTLKKRK